MVATQRLTASLTPLDAALTALLDGVSPVAPKGLPLTEALGCIAAEMQPLHAIPPCDIAIVDGWAFHARDLVGASSYSPLALPGSPVWVEAGDPMPDGSDCVVDSELVESSGLMFQALAEAIPGQGVRRAGGDMAEANPFSAVGLRLRALDLLIARAAGWEKLAVRRPRLHLINVLPVNEDVVTTQLIAESACAAGAEVNYTEVGGRDAPSIAGTLGAEPCDLLVTIGGTGMGRADVTIEALAMRGALIAHGIALQPGRTTAIGKVADIPVIALPGAPDQALAAWWTLALPVSDRLSGLQPRQATKLPLMRKIASSIGIAEIALLKKMDAAWLPLAVGDLSFDHIARADAWLAVPGGSEGFAMGTLVDAYMLRDYL